jgi:hypothetical protein
MMFYRRKILLAVLQAWGGRLPSTDLQKILFLFSKRQNKPAYDFVPYKFGCFSWQSYADKRAMVLYRQIKGNDDWIKVDDTDYLELINSDDRKELLALKKSISGLSGKDLVRHVYKEFPYYASKSEIAEKILSKDEFKIVVDACPNDSSTQLFTIGYEGRSFDGFLNCLVANNIKVLCDVRKNPLSMKYGFSKSQLKEALSELKINYLHFPELGIESGKRQNLSSTKDYMELFDEYESSTLLNAGPYIVKIIDTLESEKRIALMCFEKDPCMCHRGRLSKAIENHPKFRHSVFHLRNGDENKGFNNGKDVPNLFW